MATWPYLFAGIPVSDYAAALAWYERLLGSPPSFFPHDTDGVRKITYIDRDGNEIGFGGFPR